MIALLQKLRAAEDLTKLHHLEAKSHLSRAELHKRDQCIANLLSIGAPAVPGLIRRLADVEDADPTASVPMILTEIGDPAVPYLARAMHDPDCRLRHNAITVLGRIATPMAMRELDDESVDLIDKDAVRAALSEARHHSRPAGVAGC